MQLMKLRNLPIPFLSLTAFCALSVHAAVVERVLVRQQWPWERAIKVEYRLAEVAEKTDVSVSLSVNGVPVAMETDALDGTLFAIPADGIYSFTIDPTRTSLAEIPRTSDLRVELTAAPSSQTTSLFPLYRIYDLESGECEEVTAGEIASGFRGAWRFADPNAAHLPDAAALTNIIWTGFNADETYKTKKLVMRYLPGKTAKVNLLNRKDRPGNIGYDYYAGVYEVTQKQWELISGSTVAGCKWVADTKPVNMVSYDSIRGADETNFWSAAVGGNAPHPDSFLGKLRRRTGAAFDLPTHAMNEYATQANSLWRFSSDGKQESVCLKSGWNDNSPFAATTITNMTVDPNLPGAYNGNAGANGPAAVGSFACNQAGLYDTIGNVREWCVDWQNRSIRQSDYTSCAGSANISEENPAHMKCYDTSKTSDPSGLQRFCGGPVYNTQLSSGMTPNYFYSYSLASDAFDEKTGFRMVIVAID
jgi:formylglycine-generating enzyme required for sulfatase activity